MNTPYSKENANFSQKAHNQARTIIYPDMLKTDDINFINTDQDDTSENKILDGLLGIDKRINVAYQAHDSLSSLNLTVQERWRRSDYANFRDLTITEWNHASNLPSELHKIAAQIFLYGYYDETNKKFIEAVACNVSQLLMAIYNKDIEFTKEQNPRSGQTFICITFEQLIKHNIAFYHYIPTKKSRESTIIKISQCHLNPGWSVDRQSRLFDKYGVHTVADWNKLNDEQLRAMLAETV